MKHRRFSSGRINVMQLVWDLGMGGLEKLAIDICNHLPQDQFSASICVLQAGRRYGKSRRLRPRGFTMYSAVLRQRPYGSLQARAAVADAGRLTSCTRIRGARCWKASLLPGWQVCRQ